MNVVRLQLAVWQFFTHVVPSHDEHSVGQARGGPTASIPASSTPPVLDELDVLDVELEVPDDDELELLGFGAGAAASCSAGTTPVTSTPQPIAIRTRTNEEAAARRTSRS